eukprot:650191_1
MFSEWVDSCKSSVLQTTEWKRVSQELHNILSDKLSRDCVGFFADLTNEQQISYIKQIKRYDLKDTKIYDDFLVKLKELIERNISIQIQQLELSDHHNLTNLTRLDKILHITSEGTAKLLHDFPKNEIEYQLSGLSNMSLSPHLRKEIWKILLCNNHKYNDTHHDEQSMASSQVSSSYIQTANQKTSINTFRVTEKCETILLTLSQIIEIPNINPTQKSAGFGDLNTLLPLMKNIMIQYHQDIGFFNQENGALCDERYFHFLIPILICCTDFLTQSIINKINVYSAFEHKAYKWFKELIQCDIPNDEDQYLNLDCIRFGTEEYTKYYDELEHLIIHKSPVLLDALQSVAVTAQLIMDDKDDMEASQKPQVNWIRAIIEPVVHEMIEYWFVSIVNIETCQHIWDQLLLTRFDALPLIICALFHLISDNVRNCQNVDGFSTIAKRFLPTVHYTQFMREIQRLRYYKPDSNAIDIKDDEKTNAIHVEPIIDTIGTAKALTPMRDVSVQTKQLVAGMLMIGKLHIYKVRNDATLVPETPAVNAVCLEKEQEDGDDVLTDTKAMNQQEAKEDNQPEKTVTSLVLEDSIVQILKALRDISHMTK